jgi:arylsulfatase A-like enzyme
MRFNPSDVQNHRHQLGLLILMAALLAWWGGLKDLTRSLVNVDESAQELQRPNILMIVVDDLGYDDVSAINPNGISTPNIDSIAQEGSLFTRHYADSTCSPSRVAILTGRHPERSGFRHRGIEIPAEFPTVAELLKTVGYQTYLGGKWHAGEERRVGWPVAKGFDTSFGFLNQWQLAGDEVQKKTPTYINPWLRTGDGEMQQYKGHLTDILTDGSVKKIKQLNKTDQPWFIYHAFLAPHDPIQPAQRYRKKFPATPEGEYRALVTQLDDSVGKLLTAVKNDSNTLVVFVSDNGGTNNTRDNNYPFFGKKNEVYEGSYRTPLAIRWSGVIPKKVIDDTVMNVDILPTLVAAAGGVIPNGLDGRNLLPRIKNDIPLQKVKRSWEQHNWNIQTMTFSVLSQDGRWRMSEMYGLDPMLYDLTNDATGGTNVAAIYPQRVTELSEYYWQSHWNKSRLNVTEYLTEDNATTNYAGFDMMRTPYMFGFSIGLEIPPFDTDIVTILAEQKGVWRLSYVPGKGIEWNIADVVLNGLNFNPNQCNRIILTGDLQPGEEALAQSNSTKIIKLYSSGLLQESRSNLTYALPSDLSISNPTSVFNGGKAIFSNSALSSFTDSYSPEVPLEHHQLFEDYYRSQKLSIAQVNMLDTQLCTEQ